MSFMRGAFSMYDISEDCPGWNDSGVVITSLSESHPDYFHCKELQYPGRRRSQGPRRGPRSPSESSAYRNPRRVNSCPKGHTHNGIHEKSYRKGIGGSVCSNLHRINSQPVGHDSSYLHPGGMRDRSRSLSPAGHYIRHGMEKTGHDWSCKDVLEWNNKHDTETSASRIPRRAYSCPKGLSQNDIRAKSYKNKMVENGNIDLHRVNSHRVGRDTSYLHPSGERSRSLSPVTRYIRRMESTGLEWNDGLGTNINERNWNNIQKTGQEANDHNLNNENRTKNSEHNCSDRNGTEGNEPDLNKRNGTEMDDHDRNNKNGTKEDDQDWNNGKKQGNVEQDRNNRHGTESNGHDRNGTESNGHEWNNKIRIEINGHEWKNGNGTERNEHDKNNRNEKKRNGHNLDNRNGTESNGHDWNNRNGTERNGHDRHRTITESSGHTSTSRSDTESGGHELSSDCSESNSSESDSFTPYFASISSAGFKDSDIHFRSGRQSWANDLDEVFGAIKIETRKEENDGKDLYVLFIIGGELKILRRPAVAGNGHTNHRRDVPSMTRKEAPQPPQNGQHSFTPEPVVRENGNRVKPSLAVGRSQSFGGMANRQKTGSPPSPAPVLGESFRHHRMPPAHVTQPRSATATRGSMGFTFKKSPKVPKIPRPNRAVLMFHSVKKGVREFIEVTKEDIRQLQVQDIEGTSTSTAQQIKAAERYVKRLEFHLAKIDELHEYYMLQQQLREGVRTMHKAYVTSPGRLKDPIANVKYGYKECTQTMCQIEAQLENMMGTLNCRLKGMAGFARLCPGDVFEVTIRHGTQKWKSKGRVEKNGTQKWEVPEFTFKALVGEVINIKGVELRSFKSVVLGQKSCETKDLFSANPQLMTVSINVNGSLKLSIIITWNPLEGVDDSSAYFDMPMKSQSTSGRRQRPVSVIALNGEFDDSPAKRFSSPVSSLQQTKDDNFILRTTSSNPYSEQPVGNDSPLSRNSDYYPGAYCTPRRTLPSPVSPIQTAYPSFSSPQLQLATDSPPQPPHHSRVSPQQTASSSRTVYTSSIPPVFSHNLHWRAETGQISSTKEDSALTMEDALHSLTSLLEDYHGQYVELQKLEDLLVILEQIVRKHSPHSSRSSSISVSIESALEAFDFLDTEDAIEDVQTPVGTTSGFDDLLCSPESTAKTGDSGIESLAQRLSEDTSLGSSPVPPSTGNEQVDHCLLFHLLYCERLLENLGTFGPLKCREIYALDKLQKQAEILESLTRIARGGNEVDLHTVMSKLSKDKSLREFWVTCTTDQNTLYISPDRLESHLEQKFSVILTDKYDMDPAKVCHHLVTRVLDVPNYDTNKPRPNCVVTLHQFMLYFQEEGGLKHVEDVADEMRLIERFMSGNPDNVIKAILSLRNTLPSSPCLKVLGILLVGPDKEVVQCTISYLTVIQKKKESRDKAMIVYVEGLEDRSAEIRAGSCMALSLLEASECTDQLVYLYQSDTSPVVQAKAKEALFSLGGDDCLENDSVDLLGDEGRRAFEDAQLSRHGFQGLQVHM